MLYVVIGFLWAALCLYLLLGGADFGVGIIELFTGKKNKAKVKATAYKAIGPIWEANHMWLIIAIVILFVGFPVIYSTVSIYLHIPLVIMLLGIIARGTAFSFRHYDAVKDDWQKLYTYIFLASSFITPFFLGIIAASTVSGAIDTQSKDFLNAYIYSWLNLFGISVGLFTISISSFLASIYIIGEAADDGIFERYLIKKARHNILLVVLAGALVFMAAYYSNIPLTAWIFGGVIGQLAITLATISVAVLFWAFKHRKAVLMRLLAGFQVMMILIAATYQHYPNLILFKDGSTLSLLEHAGSEKTINSLAWALLLGSIFILPSLFYLMRAFHKSESNQRSD